MIRGALVLLSVLTIAQQAQPPRDAAPASAAAAGQPLHRVRITLNGPVQNPPTAVTDTRGEFELTDVPPGSYTLTATRAGYLTVEYGQRRPREVGRTIEVRPGAAIEKIEMALPRGSVLAGRVTDEAGDPAPGVRVEALEHRYIRGHRVLVPARITTTNDAGEYRVSGLESGSFRLRASSSDVWEGDDGKTTHVFAVTYFPGVTGTDAPQAINLNVGQEVGGLDFQLVAGSAARVTGVVEDANGQPLPDHVVYLSTLMRTTGGRVLGSGQAGPPTRTDARGAFGFSKLAPGEYLVGAGGDEERVSVPVVLGVGDVQHVVLSPRKAAEFAGNIVTDEGTPPPFLPSRLRLMPVPADPRHVLPGWSDGSGVTVRPDWSFRARDIEGPHLFRVTGLPLDWMLKTVRIGERDVTDVPLTLARSGQGFTGVEVVLTRKGALLTGDVTAVAGSSPEDVTVIVFPENSALWGPGSRYVRASRPDDKGRFSIPGLPPGTYRIIAPAAVQAGEWEDPAFLQAQARRGVRVELSEGIVETVKVAAEGPR
jgi:hypothetical protein